MSSVFETGGDEEHPDREHVVDEAREAVSGPRLWRRSLQVEGCKSENEGAGENAPLNGLKWLGRLSG